MADEEIVKAETEAPKTKEEARGMPHLYVDNNGWCLTCGRSEGWKAHTVKKAEESPSGEPSPLADTELPPTAPTRRRSNPTPPVE